MPRKDDHRSDAGFNAAVPIKLHSAVHIPNVKVSVSLCNYLWVISLPFSNKSLQIVGPVAKKEGTTMMECRRMPDLRRPAQQTISVKEQKKRAARINSSIPATIHAKRAEQHNTLPTLGNIVVMNYRDVSTSPSTKVRQP